MPDCLRWGEERHQECTQYRDNGYNSCASYERNCCTWWPCSWGCQLVAWLCVAWFWVANVVCVAWTWVTTAVCLVWDFIVLVVGVILTTIESIVGWVLSAIAFVVDLIFAIPIIGRLLRWIWDVVLAIVWFLASVPDTVLGIIGVRPEKKLRVCVVMLNDERGNRLADPATIVPDLQAAVDIFREECNVRIVPSQAFAYTTPYQGASRASADWVVGTGRGPSGNEVLDVECDTPALGEDLTTTGSIFEILAATSCFYGNWRRLAGYGAPIVVFLVRDVKGKLGCSIGPLSDYVVAEAGQPICIAHEIGHACSLWHVDGATNLMNPSCGQRQLDWWQVALVRSSRHVSYF